MSDGVLTVDGTDLVCSLCGTTFILRIATERTADQVSVSTPAFSTQPVLEIGKNLRITTIEQRFECGNGHSVEAPEGLA